MLMDEPFGAVDPIVRGHLQDEFLRLQKEMKKTICFVTHDINEAIKMGDTIAILDIGTLVQHGTPQEILSNPVNEFVSDFIGHDRVVKKLTLFQVSDVASNNPCIIRENELANISQKMNDMKAPVSFLLNGSGSAYGLITAKDLEKVNDAGPERLKEIALSKKGAFVEETELLTDALSQMLECGTEYLGVMRGNEVSGVLSMADIRGCASQKEGDS